MGLGDVLTSDILQVVAAIRNAGYMEKFKAVDIVRDVGMTEVWWMFQMSGNAGPGWVWVGDVSGRIEAEENGRRERRVGRMEAG